MGSIRQFVATTKQSDILGMRAEIVDHTKNNLDEVVLAWGYVMGAPAAEGAGAAAGCAAAVDVFGARVHAVSRSSPTALEKRAR